MTELTIGDAVRHEHDVRRARAEIAALDEAVALSQSKRERIRSRARASQGRRRLIRALLRRGLPPGPATDLFAARVDEALDEARFGLPVLDDLAALLDSGKGEPDGRAQ